MNAKKFVWVMLLVPFVFAGCLVARGPHGAAVFLAPPLPPLVILEDEPYYVQGGYHYHYQNNSWYYSHSRGGPWVALPRDRYPRETRFKHGGPGRPQERNPEHRER